MGYIRHHAVVVTGTYGDHAEQAHAKAIEIFHEPLEMYPNQQHVVSALLPQAVNGTRSFFVAPDGSKEGWPPSDELDRRRETFIAWLEQQRYDDDSSPLAWAEVQYGDEEGNTRIVNDSDAWMRA